MAVGLSSHLIVGQPHHLAHVLHAFGIGLDDDFLYGLGDILFRKLFGQFLIE